MKVTRLRQRLARYGCIAGMAMAAAPGRAEDWERQAAEDAKQDRTAIAYDGITPNKLVCDTTLRELPDGSWALFMLAGDDFEPSPGNYIGVTRSADSGRTWGRLEPVDTGFPREGKTSGQGPTELMVQDGRCTLFFSTHSQTWGRDWKSWMMHSEDSCRTWTKPQPVPGRLADFTFIRNHITTRDGRILLPFQHYLGPGPGIEPPADDPKPWHKTLMHFVSNPRNGVLMSGNGGKTWTEHGDIRLAADDRYHGWAENNIVELSGARIGMILRGDRLGGVLYYAESKDGGRTWPEFAEKTEIPNPGSKATLYPLGGDAVALLHNPNPKHRSPLALWVSFDGMKTWPYRRVLVPESCDGPKGNLNYPDGFVSKDRQWLHFAFDDNRHRAVYYGAKLPPVRKSGRAGDGITMAATSGERLAVEPGSVDGKSFDLVVIGGTPGGIACAVRAAREGLRVLVVNRHAHLGGILSSGLGVWDTQHEGKRSPIYDEVRAAIMEHYRSTYGADSPQYRDALPGPSGYTNGRFEPRVAERIFDELVAREPGVTVLRGFLPVEVEREGAMLAAVTLRASAGERRVRISGGAFVDATYEGDLLPLAKVPYRTGREARGEFNEPHAGILFMRPRSEAPSQELERLSGLHERLKLRKFAGWQEVMPESTGAADPAVQACNYRTILSTDPANRVPIKKPAHYDPYYLKSLEIFSGVASIPNGKFGWNRPQIVGRQTAYVEADWDARRRIEDEHWDATMGLLYFLQNDLSVPELVRRAWQEYGLAADEFADNGHRPHEMYVREARRLVGRAVFTEHDATLAQGLGRAPVHPDSVAATEWYMDSHSCSTARVPGGLEEGKMMLHNETFPAQVPYQCLLPKGVDNLLVPVCLSATHVAWGTVRLEPVWMQTGEAAGVAAALAAARKIPPADLDAEPLVRRLCSLRSMVSFFNDVDVSGTEPWVPAVQYFGTRGFFHDYDARLDEPLKAGTGRAWVEGFGDLLGGRLDANAICRAVAEGERSAGTLTAAEFAAQLPARRRDRAERPDGPMTRKDAIQLLFRLLP